MAHQEPIRFHVMLPPELYESLKEVAGKEGRRSVASLVREACEQRVKPQEASGA